MGAVRGVSLISRSVLVAVVAFTLGTGSALAADDEPVVLCDVGISCGNEPNILLKGAVSAKTNSVILKYTIETFGLDTSVVVSYGLEDSLSNATTKEGNFLAGSGSATDDEIKLTDLPAGQKIFYKITATNDDGTTESATDFFSTLPEPTSNLAVETLPVTNIGSTTATLNGKVISNGTNNRYVFSLKTEGEPQLQFSPSTTNLGSLEPTYNSYDVGSLKPDTTYVTVFAAGGSDEGSSDDAVAGQEVTFKTKPAESATTSNAAPTSGTASTQTVATTISRLAVGVKSALFQSGKKIHFVLDMSASGEVSLRVKKLNAPKRASSCKRVSYRSWIMNRDAFKGCKIVLFPTAERIEVKAGRNRVTYRPLRPLSAGTYRATFKVVGDKSTKSVKFKVSGK